MRTRMLVPLALFVFASAFAVLSVNAQSENGKTKVIRMTQTDPSNGKEMYNAYCAVCHGLDGRGNGPAASGLKTPPPDLTLLSRTHGGKFPTAIVVGTLRGGPAMPAVHGSPEMPIWGRLFLAHQQDQGVASMRIANVAEYIESIQVK